VSERSQLSRITTAIALFAALVVAISAPLGYYYLARADDEGRMSADANVRAFMISQVVSSDPDIWMFKAHAIQGIASRTFNGHENDLVSVMASDGTLLYSNGPKHIPAPSLTVTAPIYDSGHLVGQVEVRHSLRHLLPITGLVGILSSIVGLGVFFAVRMFPMRALEQAWERATHDPLTGLPNRLLLADRIEQAAALSARSDMTFAIHCLDLDHFKDINDMWGHGVGDMLLAEAGQRLTQCVHKGDTIARVGGDEFVVLQTNIKSPDDAASTAEKLIQSIGKPFNLRGHQAMLSTSIGLALYEKHDQNVSELLQNADNALYRAKSTQRGTFQFFDKTLNEKLDVRKQTERELRTALAAGEFELLYEPQINLPSGKITGVEALVRWHHPTRGLLGPDEFIPLAEETGLIVPIGQWILRTACEQASKWRNISLAVNVSPVQFRKDKIVAVVRAALEESGLPAEKLQLEITESILLTDTEATLGILGDLRKLGVRIVMDDFGTGYSSLGYLRRFAFDKIKLDKSFVHDLGQNADADAIAHTIIDLARTLRITANAEGVESQRQLDWLIDQGCGEAQGYWFARPLPFAGIDQLLTATTTAAPSFAKEAAPYTPNAKAV
jgi:diguanylate cyclase (GGDEF)-like protein